MKKTFVFFCFIYSLLHAGATEYSLKDAIEDIPDVTTNIETTEDEPSRYPPITITPEADPLTCTIEPFTRSRAKQLFRSTASIDNTSKEKNFANFHNYYLPIKIVIKNNSNQNLVISSWSPIWFKNPEATHSSEKVYPFPPCLIPYFCFSLHYPEIMLSGIATIKCLSILLGNDIPRWTLRLLSLPLIAICCVYFFDDYKGIIKKDAEKEFKKDIEKLKQFNNKNSIDLFHGSYVIPPNATFITMRFIETVLHPEIVKKLTSTAPSQVIIGLDYKLEPQ